MDGYSWGMKKSRERKSTRNWRCRKKVVEVITLFQSISLFKNCGQKDAVKRTNMTSAVRSLIMKKFVLPKQSQPPPPPRWWRLWRHWCQRMCWTYSRRCIQHFGDCNEIARKSVGMLNNPIYLAWKNLWHLLAKKQISALVQKTIKDFFCKKFCDSHIINLNELLWVYVRNDNRLKFFQ